MITAEKLTFGFHSTLLFQNISFTLEENCHCALIGSNGTGKTTLMNLIREPEHYIFEGKLRQLPMTNENSRKFKRFFQAGATDCEVDNQGRILLPATLREFAGITKDVTIVGVGERAEIWSKEKWEEKNNIDDIDFNELAQGIEDLGIMI